MSPRSLTEDRSTSGQCPLSPRKRNVGENCVRSTLEPLAANKKLAFKVEMPSELPLPAAAAERYMPLPLETARRSATFSVVECWTILLRSSSGPGRGRRKTSGRPISDSYPPKAPASRRAPCQSRPSLRISSAQLLDCSVGAPPAPDLPRGLRAALPLQRSEPPARRRVP